MRCAILLSIPSSGSCSNASLTTASKSCLSDPNQMKSGAEPSGRRPLSVRHISASRRPRWPGGSVASGLSGCAKLSSNTSASIDSRTSVRESSDLVQMRPETAAFFTAALLSSTAYGGRPPHRHDDGAVLETKSSRASSLHPRTSSRQFGPSDDRWRSGHSRYV